MGTFSYFLLVSTPWHLHPLRSFSTGSRLAKATGLCWACQFLALSPDSLEWEQVNFVALWLDFVSLWLDLFPLNILKGLLIFTWKVRVTERERPGESYFHSLVHSPNSGVFGRQAVAALYSALSKDSPWPSGWQLTPLLRFLSSFTSRHLFL